MQGGMLAINTILGETQPDFLYSTISKMQKGMLPIFVELFYRSQAVQDLMDTQVLQNRTKSKPQDPQTSQCKSATSSDLETRKNPQVWGVSIVLVLGS